MKYWCWLLLLSGCGIDVRTKSDPVPVNIPNSTQTVLYKIDVDGFFKDLQANLKPLCEQASAELPDGPEKDEAVAACILKYASLNLGSLNTNGSVQPH